jgi:cytochrome oxidase Cu insertion factor (SCO1/SenC/PrrC family)
VKPILRILALITATFMLSGVVNAGADSPATVKKAASSAERVPTLLPTFAVTDVNGTSLSSGQLVQKGKWLLLYMNAACQRCDAFLHTLRPNATPGRSKKIVVIVGQMEPARLKDFASQYRDWSQVQWYADQQQQAFSQLKMTGVPVTLGMMGDHIQWVLNAPPSSATFHKSALNTWLK